MNKARLVVEPTIKQAGMLRLGARLLRPDGANDYLWWEVSEAWGEALTPWADPWVIGLIFPIMQSGVPVHVEGRVSPSLLANLELFMRIWERRAPGKYRPVPLSAEAEIELPAAPEPKVAVGSFSCGVDSCFTRIATRSRSPDGARNGSERRLCSTASTCGSICRIRTASMRTCSRMREHCSTASACHAFR